MTSIFKYMIVSYMQTTLSLPDEESYCALTAFPQKTLQVKVFNVSKIPEGGWTGQSVVSN